MLMAFLIAMEVTARLDDYVHQGTPLLSNPDRELDLLTRELWGYRGKPNGHFQKWKLNAFGFRGPEITRSPPEGTTRIMVLGASETFGLMESPGREYPAQLQHLLDQSGRFEVINGATAGMSLKTMADYWENWASQFRPQIVLIYPTPIFYLRDDPPGSRAAAGSTAEAERSPHFRCRLFDRVAGAYRGLPLSIRNFRRQWKIQREIAAKDTAWFFSEPPADRLQMFHDDAARLVREIRRRGAVPILVTYAMSADSPPRPEDFVNLNTMRYDFLRASAEMIAAFEIQGNQALQEIAERDNVVLIDAARELSGRREFFGDLVHFNDAGAGQMARLLACELVSLPSPANAASPLDRLLDDVADDPQVGSY
jgi:hypothetical protein